MLREAGAVFDLSDRYRYLLWRCWDTSLPVVGFVMLNPSTADAERLDPTNTRCFHFARAWGFGTMLVGNVFGYRSTDPRALRTIEDPFGPDNDRFLSFVSSTTAVTVVAWGNHAERFGGHSRALQALDTDLYCLGRTKHGHPRHPLYVHGSTQPERFTGA